jgi:HD-like signal output (HDOD) protein
MLQQQKKTGLLSLVSRQDERGIFFNKGDLVYATSRDCSRRLGDFLVSLGFIAESDVRDAAGAKDWGTRFLGQELVDRGAIHPDELHAAVRKQILDILDDVLLWEEGAFHFDEWFDPSVHPIPNGPVIGTRSILLEAIRRYDESQFIRASFPDLSVVLQVPVVPESLPGVADDVLALISGLIDGKRTVSQILRDSPRSPYETSTVLAALSRQGRLQPVAVRRVAAESPSVPEPWSLPIAPDVPPRFFWIFRQKTASHMDLIAGEVVRDPSLTAKALQLFSASRLALPRERFGIRKVLEALGDFRTRSLLVPEIIRGIYFAEKEHYWGEWKERSIFCASFCQDLANRVGYPYPEEAYLAGLLSNLGIFVLVGAYGDRYREVLETAGSNHEELAAMEEREFGVSHAIIGRVYAERWKFPKPIAQTIESHHYDWERPAPLLDLVAMANWTSHVRTTGTELSGDEEQRIEGALKRFKLKRKKLLALSEGTA